jgi:hypothetical protein
MNIDGNTYIIYDKYAGDHSYNNPLTSNINIESLVKSDTVTVEGEEALKEFNMISVGPNKLKNIDLTFYKLIMFKLKIKMQDVNILVVGVNHQQLKERIDNLPNEDFLIYACSCHISYERNSTAIKKKLDIAGRKNELTILATGCNTDRTDPIIENPHFTKINLFDYQRRTVRWMYDKEKSKSYINYSFNDEIFFGEYVCDTIRKEIISTKNRKSIEFRGGLLADEVGLGKTFQIIALSLLNPPINISYFSKEDKRLQSRATLIICPNQLCNQWIREIGKTIKDDYKVVIIPMMTKVHFDKYTYIDVLDADFVVVSYNFLGNDSYYKPWLKLSSKINSYLRSQDSLNNINNTLDTLYEVLESLPEKLYETNPVLNCIKFHRIVCDEFHEIYTVDKYNYLRTIIKAFIGNYKWCVTGTPFNKGDCVEKMIEYVSNYKAPDTQKILLNDMVYNYIAKNFFRRNTKQSIKDEYKLEPYDEKIILMKLSPTERAIYSAYLANPNVSRFSVLVRQLCNDPRLAEEIKLSISTCKTPEEIEKTMVNHYQRVANIAKDRLELLQYRLKKVLRKITVTEYKRYRRFLKNKDTWVEVEYPPKIYEQKYEKNNDLDEDNIKDDTEEDTDDEEEKKGKKIILINKDTVKDLVKRIQNQLTKNPSVTLENLNRLHESYKINIDKAEKEYRGKKSTCEFFTNMLNKLNKLKSGEELDEEDKDTCPICLNEITGDDVGVTKCGHIFCYECIKQNIIKQPKCPTCMKPSTSGDIYMISYEKAKPLDTKDAKDKQALVAKIGTKLANLVLFIKSSKGKSIVFSQWDDMLYRTGEVLTSHGIKNVFCRGNVWSRDKAIRDFTNQDDIKVIMLSSESSAAGTNLTTAENVIILDAIYKDDNVSTKGIGSYEYRRNMEWQAIGRAYRMGQTKKVHVVRFIMKDTVEEEIYKINKEEDKKFKDNVDLIDKMVEMDDEKIIAGKDEIEKMTKLADIYNKNKKSKAPTKVKAPVNNIPVDDIIDSEFDSDFDD